MSNRFLEVPVKDKKSGFPGREVQVVGKHPIAVLGTKLGSAAKALSTLSHCSINISIPGNCEDVSFNLARPVLQM